MCCMCIPAFIVTSADVMGIFTDILREEACNVYGAWVILYCICIQTFILTCANIS